MSKRKMEQRQSSNIMMILLALAAVASVSSQFTAQDFRAVSIVMETLVLICLVIAAWIHVVTCDKLKSLQNILDAAPSGILCVNIAGIVQYANPTACNVFQYDSHQLTGLSVDELIPASIRHKHPGLRNSFLQEKRSRRMGEGRDIRGVTRDGQEVPLEIGLTFLGDGDNAIIVVGVIDIRELKNAQTIIERQNHNLARSVKELEQFAFVASHDLREPLRKVMNYVELMLEDYAAAIDDDGRSVLRSMASAVQRMEGLLDSLLNYSRVTTRAQPFETVSLQEILRDVEEDLSLVISETDAQVEFDALPNVLGDRNQLRQLFQNLISNSIKYHRKDVPPQIRIESSNTPHPKGLTHFISITLSDNGIGFDNQYCELIFDVFKRLHGRDKYQGTGMGLAICRKIVERHEGLILADGRLDEGATFTIWLRSGKVS